MSDSLQAHGLYPTGLLSPWDFPGKSTGVGCHFLLQQTFLTQGLNPCLQHCRQTRYHLSHQGRHKYKYMQSNNLIYGLYQTQGKTAYTYRVAVGPLLLLKTVLPSYLTLGLKKCSWVRKPGLKSRILSSCPISSKQTNWITHKCVVLFLFLSLSPSFSLPFFLPSSLTYIIYSRVCTNPLGAVRIYFIVCWSLTW